MQDTSYVPHVYENAVQVSISLFILYSYCIFLSKMECYYKCKVHLYYIENIHFIKAFYCRGFLEMPSDVTWPPQLYDRVRCSPVRGQSRQEAPLKVLSSLPMFVSTLWHCDGFTFFPLKDTPQWFRKEFCRQCDRLR